MKTKIPWCTHSLNPGIYGCSKCSPGCLNCYAAKMAHRQTAMGNYPAGITELGPAGVRWTGKVITDKQKIESGLDSLPKKKPIRVFITSMADVLHPSVSFHYIRELWDEMFDSLLIRPNHTYLILTKRAFRLYTYCQYLEAVWNRRSDYDNLWLGITVCNQLEADRDMPIFKEVAAKVKFISVEPMLGMIKFRNLTGIDWVIVGGETGPGARPMHPKWAESIRNQCQVAGIPFFFKQWGEFKHYVGPPVKFLYMHGHGFYRVRKDTAGRLLDGREWNEIPVTE